MATKFRMVLANMQGLHYGTCLMSLFWHLEFRGGAQIFGTLCTSDIMYLGFGLVILRKLVSTQCIYMQSKNIVIVGGKTWSVWQERKNVSFLFVIISAVTVAVQGQALSLYKTFSFVSIHMNILHTLCGISFVGGGICRSKADVQFTGCTCGTGLSFFNRIINSYNIVCHLQSDSTAWVVFINNTCSATLVPFHPLVHFPLYNKVYYMLC